MHSQNIGQWTLNAVQQALDRLIREFSTAYEARVKVTPADTTPDFLDDKIDEGAGLTRTVLNPGANEKFQLNVRPNADGSIIVNADDVQVGVLATDSQHGNRGGGALHVDATNVVAGFMSAADKAKLDILGSIERVLVVGLSGQVDDTAINTAITTAIAGGASAATPWLISVKPGTYTEPPMTIPPGIALVAEANRIDTVFVVASNAAADLFTCTGGYIAGIRASGVTDPTKALFRCDTASSLVVMHGVSIRGCSTGVSVENGASCILTNFSIVVAVAGMAVTTGIKCSDAGSFLGITGIFISVPAAVLPAYPGSNPVQTGVHVVSNAVATISDAVINVAYNVADQDGVVADDGAVVSMFSANLENNANATRIGSVGANTRFVVQGGTFQNNLVNGDAQSSTSVYQVVAETDSTKFTGVAGAKLNGVIQVSGTAETLLAGDTEYIYPSENQVNFGEYLYHMGTTGLFDGGVVTDAGGLSVDVASGLGFSSRGAPNDDIETVSWAQSLGLALTANSTNFIYYDAVTQAIVAGVAPVGQQDILLSTAVTNGVGIRYLHTTRNLVDQQPTELHEYLLMTRKIAWTSGLATTQGSTIRKLDVAAGSWYRALDLLSVVGGSDVTWSYYYGAGAASELPAVVDLDITQYDNAGVLTAMTASYFRADTVIITSDNRVSIIYGVDEFATQAEAEDLVNKASIPDFMSQTGCYSAMVVVQQTAGVGGIVSIIDIRPNPNAATAGGGGGGAGTNDHSALINLPNDDHLQYYRTDGGRAMTGDPDIGGNNIVNVGTVDGVDVSAHAPRHDPGGADALALGSPVTIGTTNTAGAAASFPRSDHQHAHGNQTSQTLHAVATAVLNGFMAAVDKAKLDALVARGYAEIYLNVPVSQAVGGVAVDLDTFDTDGLSLNATPDEANSRITITVNGTYDVSFSISFSGSNNATYTFLIAVDGVTQNRGGIQRKLGVGGDVGSASFNCPLSLTAGQQVTVRVSSTGATLNAEYANLNIERM